MLTIKNRKEAGKLLAEKLRRFRTDDTIILALPRGGVVLGYEIAKDMSCPLDIIVLRKIGHPAYPEYAIGAVDPKGYTILNEGEVVTIDETWLKKEIEREKDEAGRRLVEYTKGREKVSISGKDVILVDDGIATGFTMRLALKITRDQKPKSIIIAVPVSSGEIINLLQREGAEKIVTLVPPEHFLGAIGSHYEEFDQVQDGEVIRLLGKAVPKQI